MAADNTLRQIKLIMYRLKRNYGRAITYVRYGTRTHNVQTGAISGSTTKYSITRAIVMPQRNDHSFVYDLAYIATLTGSPGISL
jgi:hypothetical protein